MLSIAVYFALRLEEKCNEKKIAMVFLIIIDLTFILLFRKQLLSHQASGKQTAQ